MLLLWIELGLLTVLGSLLLWSRWRQLKQQLRRQLKVEISLRGHGFDTSLVQRRLSTLRKDYCAAFSGSKKTPQHELFAAAVRQSLRQLSYFRSLAQTERETQSGHAQEAR